MKNIAYNILDNKNYIKNTIKEENDQDEVLSNTSQEDDTIPDEDFNFVTKKRDKMNSFPNVLSPHRGPNINLKIFHKRYSNQKEKEMFFEKIKRKKKTELCKNYELYKDCYYGDNCSFAHGIDELRENYAKALRKIMFVILASDVVINIRSSKKYILILYYLYLFYLFDLEQKEFLLIIT